MTGHDEKSSLKDMIRDISNKKTPDSVRESAYRELGSRGINKDKARQIADKKHGDFWG